MFMIPLALSHQNFELGDVGQNGSALFVRSPICTHVKGEEIDTLVTEDLSDGSEVPESTGLWILECELDPQG